MHRWTAATRRVIFAFALSFASLSVAGGATAAPPVHTPTTSDQPAQAIAPSSSASSLSAPELRNSLHPHALGPPIVVADTLDRYNLFKRRLFNRQLFEQLADESQRFRVGEGLDTLAFAVDAQVGSTQVLSGEFSRFHGYFVFDTFAALRAPYGFDLNLNLALFNPSASDGVRVSSEALPSGTLHFYHETRYADHDVRFDLLGTDLGTMTLGNGLLLEQWPLEGAMGNLAIDDFYLRHVFGGRVFWPDDDVFTLQAGVWDGAIEAMLLGWKFRYHEPDIAWFLDASAKLPLWKQRVQLAAEYGVNLRERPRHGGLLRADYRDGVAGFDWHVGYQFRFYQRGFGPLQELDAPSTHYNLPYREEQYVNNSFEYFGASSVFDQWSHGTMAEIELPLGCAFETFAQGELIAGFARGDGERGILIRLPQGRELPGPWLAGFYRAGLRLYPWARFPHRLSTWVTNKQVESAFYQNVELPLRFRPHGHWYSMQLEFFL